MGESRSALLWLGIPSFDSLRMAVKGYKGRLSQASKAAFPLAQMCLNNSHWQGKHTLWPKMHEVVNGRKQTFI
jgi:hypothetical protein